MENMLSNSSSDRGLFLSSMSFSHRSMLYCSGVMGTRNAIWPGVGVASSMPPMGVIPGVNIDGVAAPCIGVALPMVAGVSSHCDLCFFGVGVARPASLGVASQVMPAGVAPGVAPPPAGVASASEARPGVGVSSHRFLRLAETGVASVEACPGVGVTSHRLGPVWHQYYPTQILPLPSLRLPAQLIPPVASLRPRTLGSSNSYCYRCTRKLSFGRHCGFLFRPPFSFLLLLHGNQAQGLLLVPLQSLLPHNNWEGAHRGFLNPSCSSVTSPRANF